MHDHRLGALLLENPLMREEDLDRCLEIQQLTGGARPLGQILVDEGVISADDLEQLLDLQSERRSTGPIEAEVDTEDLANIFEAAVAAGVEEIILSEGRRVMVRVGGQLQALTSTQIDHEIVRQFILLHCGEEVLEQLETRHCVRRDLAIDGVARGRMVLSHHADGLSVTVRLHRAESRTLEDLGVADSIRPHLATTQGLVLVVGERRCGITETLGAMLSEVQEQPDRVITVIDENLEHARTDHPAVVVRRRVGEHTRDYATGVRSAFDQEADVLIVGDASRPEVFDLCLRAAEAGRLVVAAISGRSVLSALERTLSFYPAREEARVRSTLASVLRFVLVMQLVPRATAEGQVAATELLCCDDVVRQVVREGPLSQIDLLMRLDGAKNGHTMDTSLVRLLKSGQVLFHDALARAEDKATLLNVKTGGKARA